MITKHADGSATVLAYGGINEFEISAQGIARGLSEMEIEKGSDIELRIHSYGGSVFEAAAIMSQLSEYNVTAIVDGIAASAAATIALAADTLKMSKGSQLMIHNPWSMVVGEADDMRKQADILDKIKEDMAEIYKARLGDDAAAQMDEETWFTAQEALDAGIIDDITEGFTKPAALVVESDKVLGFDATKTRFVACVKPDELTEKLHEQHGELLDQLSAQAIEIKDFRDQVKTFEEAAEASQARIAELEAEAEAEKEKAEAVSRKLVSMQATLTADAAAADELDEHQRAAMTAWEQYKSISDRNERLAFLNKNRSAILASQPKG